MFQRMDGLGPVVMKRSQQSGLKLRMGEALKGALNLTKKTSITSMASLREGQMKPGAKL